MYLHTLALYTYLAFAYLSLFILFYLLFSFLLGERKRPAPKPLKGFVSIIVPAYNEEESIVATLNSLAELDYPKDRYEVIVVDDGSSDATFELALMSGFRVLRKENQGKKSYALNYAIPFAKGDVIATLDADSKVERSSLKHAVEELKHYDAVVSSVVVWNDRDGILARAQQPEYLLILFVYREVLGYKNSIHVTPGPFSLFRREPLEERKRREGFYFDNKSITEDHELALWLQANNYTIGYAELSKVRTKVPTTFRELLNQRIRWGRGGLRNALKYLHTMSPRYGDYAILGVPLDISYLGSVFVGTLAAIAALAEPINLPLHVSFALSVNGFTIALLAVAALYVLFTFYGYAYMAHKLKEPFSIGNYLLHMVVTPILYLFVILGITWQELLNRSPSWLTKG